MTLLTLRLIDLIRGKNIFVFKRQEARHFKSLSFKFVAAYGSSVRFGAFIITGMLVECV